MPLNLYGTLTPSAAQPKRRPLAAQLGVLGTAAPAVASPAAPAAMPTAGAAPAAQPGSPSAGSDPFGTSIGRTAPPPVSPLGGGPRAGQFRYANFFGANARRANPFLWSALQQLIGQANQNRFSGAGEAAYLEPRLQGIDDAQRSAEGHLTQNLESRGLGDSSAMATGLGQLYASGANARSGALTGLYGAEEQRQLAAQDQVRSLLMSLLGQGGQAASIYGNIRGQDQTQQQIDAANRGPGLGDILGSLLGAGGSFLGGPLASKLFGGGGGDGGGQNPAIYKNGWGNYP